MASKDPGPGPAANSERTGAREPRWKPGDLIGLGALVVALVSLIVQAITSAADRQERVESARQSIAALENQRLETIRRSSLDDLSATISKIDNLSNEMEYKATSAGVSQVGTDTDTTNLEGLAQELNVKLSMQAINLPKELISLAEKVRDGVRSFEASSKPNNQSEMQRQFDALQEAVKSFQEEGRSYLNKISNSVGDSSKQN